MLTPAELDQRIREQDILLLASRAQDVDARLLARQLAVRNQLVKAWAAASQQDARNA